MLNIKIYKKLYNFDLDINFCSNQKLIAITGKSGSGKTTLLRCIAGFEKCSGSIKISNQEWIHLPPQKRDFGIVFQNYALFPNMKVYENLLFANNDIEKMKYLINLMELQDIKNLYPHQLSGGQKQRVALARALMNEVKILLLDEPFSALNKELKNKLHEELQTIKKNFNIQILMVSHDISEIYKLADEIIEINNGKIANTFQPDMPLAKLIQKNKDHCILEYNGEIIKLPF